MVPVLNTLRLKTIFSPRAGVFLAVVTVGLGFFSTSASAATGIHKQINFQGKVVNANGTNVTNGSYNFTFSLYTVSSGGTNIWTETKSLTVTDGVFRTSLGDTTSLPGSVDFNTDNLYLGVNFNSDGEMTPRIRFTAVPYAFNAQKVAGLTVTDTTGTLTIPNAKTISFADAFTTSGANPLTLTTTGTTNITLPTTGTLLTNTATANQTFTSTQTTGTVLGITDSTGLTGAITGQSITLSGAGAFDQTGLSFNLSNATGTNLNDIVGTGGSWKISKGGALTVASCTGCGAGGGGSSNWTLENGVLHPNNGTLDILFGGNSTSSAKFAFGNFAAGTPTATFSGDLIINNKPTTAASDMQKWSKVTGTAGTIGGNNTAIASISAAVVYNGSLYVGTNKTDQAEVYRYDVGGGSWSKVSGTAGTVGGGATTAIDMISSLTVYNGYLYAGTQEADKAEIYRYDGSSTWTKVSQATAGTIRSGGSATIDGVSSLAVFGGRLFAGTRESGRAEIYMYNGGTTWSVVNGTAGTFVATNTIAVDAITQMVVWNNQLIAGTLKNSGDADVIRWNGIVGGSNFFALNLASITGSYLIDNTAVTGYTEVSAMTIWAGKLIVGLRRGANQADVLMYQQTPGGAAPINSWTRLNSAAGTIGSANIDSVTAMTVYNGRLYVGTTEPNAAEIYRYDTGQSWTKVSQNTAGMIASGGTGSIDSIATLISYNHNSLFAGTLEGTTAEGYSYVAAIDQSYALRFHAGTSQAGGEQLGNANLASIFFVASLSANVNNRQGNTGSFVFSHSITTNNGSYDVAEDYPTRDDTLEPGDVVSIDTNERGFIKKSDGAYDYSVIGVYSESPALRLSQEDNIINGGRAVPIALAGRVPIKVSLENGEIKAGDYLTSSSTPGVAMKAKKAGVVIGKAMESYSEEGVGKIMGYVSSTSYNGSIAASFATISPSESNFSEKILTSLREGNAGLQAQSEVVSDRVVAGLELVSPKITTDILFAKKIHADEVELSSAAWEKLFTNGGLAPLQSSMKKQEERIASLEQLFATNSAQVHRSPSETVSQATSSSGLQMEGKVVAVRGLEVNGSATVAANLRIKGNMLIENILNIIDTLTTKQLIVNQLATFFGNVVFSGDVIFKGQPTFTSDTAGVATIKKDSTRVEIQFINEYKEAPIVSASLVLDNITKAPNQSDEEQEKAQGSLESEILESDVRYVVTRRTTKGFLIVLNKPAKEDVTFSWTAFATSNSKAASVQTINPAFSPTPLPTESLNRQQNYDISPTISDDPNRREVRSDDSH